MKRSILLFLIFVTISLTAAAQTAKRTVTNADLEKYRQKRVQAEEDYRANYKQLGMPSPEELKRQEAERQAWQAEYAKQAQIENQQTQGYFQARANQLKSQIVGVQAQINYLRGQIGNLPEQNSVFLRPEQICAVGVLPYSYYPSVVGGRGYYSNPRGTIVNQAPNAQAAINNAASAPNPYAGTAQAQTGVKVVIGQPNTYRRRGGSSYYPRPYYYGGYASTCGVNDGSIQRDDLVSRLSYLEQTKAGLLAQLNSLREEARRAGVRID